LIFRQAVLRVLFCLRGDMGRQENFLGFLKQVFLIFAVFLAVLFFLHQKIDYFIQAYELSEENREFTLLKDRKDSLLYNVAQKTAISKINGWRAENEFDVVMNDRISVLYAPEKNIKVQQHGFARALTDFIYKGSQVPNAFAQEHR